MNRKIIDTKHAIDRFTQRYNNLFNKERVEKVIYDAMKIIINKYNDEATTYGIWSKSTGICVIIDWRKDTKNRADKNNHAIIITLPPIKKEFKNFHTINSNDIRIIVEKALESAIIKKLLTEDTEDYEPNKIKVVKVNRHLVYLHEGTMYDSGIAYCIQVR